MKWEGDESEIIILGSGLGGLVAGTWLSKRNRSVLLLKEKGYERSHAEKGFRFLPFSNMSERRLKPDLLQKISEALDLSLWSGAQREEGRPQGNLDIPEQDVAFQVILPTTRIDLYSQPSLFQREWTREFPKETLQIERFYTEIDHLRHLLMKMRTREGEPSFFPLRPRSFMKWRPFEGLRKEKVDHKLLAFSMEFRQFIHLQLLSWGNLYPDRVPIELAAHVLSPNGRASDGIASLDIEELEKKILAEYERAGGKVDEIERVERIEKKGRGFLVSFEGEQRVIRSNQLILNSPLHRLSKLMGGGENPLSRWGKRIQPRFVVLPFFVGIRDKVIPIGMRDLLVSILDLEKPYEDGNLLLLGLGPKGDENQAPEGKRALVVESLIPFGRQEDQMFLLESQERVMEHLELLFPFLERHIDFTDFNWAVEQVQRWSYPHYLYGTTFDFHWRKGIVPSRISRELYFVGKENFPSMGVEGEALSGLMAAQQISEKYR